MARIAQFCLSSLDYNFAEKPVVAAASSLMSIGVSSCLWKYAPNRLCHALGKCIALLLLLLLVLVLVLLFLLRSLISRGRNV